MLHTLDFFVPEEKNDLVGKNAEVVFGTQTDNGLIRILLLRFSHCAYNGESDTVQRKNDVQQLC